MWGVRNNRDIFVHLVLHGRSGIAREKDGWGQWWGNSSKVSCCAVQRHTLLPLCNKTKKKQGNRKQPSSDPVTLISTFLSSYSHFIICEVHHLSPELRPLSHTLNFNSIFHWPFLTLGFYLNSILSTHCF